MRTVIVPPLLALIAIIAYYYTGEKVAAGLWGVAVCVVWFVVELLVKRLAAQKPDPLHKNPPAS